MLQSLAFTPPSLLKKAGQPACAQTSSTIYNSSCVLCNRQPHDIAVLTADGGVEELEPIKEQCKQPVGRHGEHGPLIDLFSHMDVLLTRDGDLLWLIFEVLDVIVDVEYVFVELGKIMELWRKEEKGDFKSPINCNVLKHTVDAE